MYYFTKINAHAGKTFLNKTKISHKAPSSDAVAGKIS